jgi:2-keto-4-pentenoate hydratase
MLNDEVVRALIDGRKSGGKMKAYPGPTPASLAEAFAIQCAVRDGIGWTHCGWKIGCTSERAQAALKTDGPFPGPVFRERLFKSGVRLKTLPENSRTTEPEIAFTMAEDCPPLDHPYTVDKVLARVASVHAAIEIVNPRLPRGFDDVVEWYVADGGLNDTLTLNGGVPPLPRDAYAKIACRVSINGLDTYEGLGANALGGPELALTWLANDLIGKGLHLRAGDVVTTGVITPVFYSALGDRVEVEFDRLGKVAVSF